MRWADCESVGGLTSTGFRVAILRCIPEISMPLGKSVLVPENVGPIGWSTG